MISLTNHHLWWGRSEDVWPVCLCFSELSSDKKRKLGIGKEATTSRESLESMSHPRSMLSSLNLDWLPSGHQLHDWKMSHLVRWWRSYKNFHFGAFPATFDATATVYWLRTPTSPRFHRVLVAFSADCMLNQLFSASVPRGCSCRSSYLCQAVGCSRSRLTLGNPWEKMGNQWKTIGNDYGKSTPCVLNGKTHELSIFLSYVANYQRVQVIRLLILRFRSWRSCEKMGRVAGSKALVTCSFQDPRWVFDAPIWWLVAGAQLRSFK